MDHRRTSGRQKSQKIPDPDFIYNTPIASKSAKRKLKKQKQREMRSNPETLYADYGEMYGPIKGNVDNKEVVDIQFHTNRPSIWAKEIMGHLDQQFAQNKIPAQPEILEKATGKQIKVNKPPSNSHYLTVFVYNNGTVLVQGTKFESWCKSEFQTIVDRVKGESRKKEVSSVPIDTVEKSNLANSHHKEVLKKPQEDNITSSSANISSSKSIDFAVNLSDSILDENTSGQKSPYNLRLCQFNLQEPTAVATELLLDMEEETGRNDQSCIINRDPVEASTPKSSASNNISSNASESVSTNGFMTH